MSTPGFRLKPSKNHSFNGHQIVRDKRMRFKLNGREYRAYQGDTILTALLASGVFGAGHKSGSPIALDGALGLCVKPAGTPDDVTTALPIDRTPVRHGMDVEVYGAPGGKVWGGFGKNTPSSLQIDFDRFGCAPGPLHDAPISRREKINLLVIGGGIAGMTAAVTAAQAGKKVMLVERRGYLGGDAELFGYAEGEEDPREIVARLTQEIDGLKTISVLTHAEAISAADGKVLVHLVEDVDGELRPGLMRVSPRNIVLATGTSDGLPLFPGNRLPQVLPMMEAYHLATAYGLWFGAQSVVFTNSNSAYRFAGLAQNAEAEFSGIYDARADRASRFIDMAKAGGQRILNGAQVQSASQNQRDGKLALEMEPSHKGFPALEPVVADQLIFNDGWLPRLALWQQVGGQVDTEGEHVEESGPENVALAGSCAGLRGHVGVMLSAEAAVGGLMLKKQVEVHDPQIDAHFETPEGPKTVSTSVGEPDMAPVYTSLSGSFVVVESTRKRGLFGKVFGGKAATSELPIADQALSYEDTLVLARRGVLPEDQLEAILRERAVAPHVFETGERRERRKYLADSVAKQVPEFINARFGESAEVWSYTVESGAPPQTGTMLFPNTDVGNPLEAIGVIAGGGEIAFVRANGAQPASVLVARLGAQSSTIRIGEQLASG